MEAMGTTAGAESRNMPNRVPETKMETLAGSVRMTVVCKALRARTLSWSIGTPLTAMAEVDGMSTANAIAGSGSAVTSLKLLEMVLFPDETKSEKTVTAVMFGGMLGMRMSQGDDGHTCGDDRAEPSTLHPTDIRDI